MVEQTETPERGLLETTCNLEKVAIIFNPASGTQDGSSRRSSLEAIAQGAGLKCGLIETERDRGAGPLVSEALAKGIQRVLVSGGDGSATEAAQVMAGTGAALAVLPGGTGNLLALNLGIPSDCDAAMRLALNGKPRSIDVGRANGMVFLLVAGIGADGRMIRDANRAFKRRLGVLAYLVAAIRNIGRHPVRFTVTIDGRRLRRIAQTVMVANMGRITGGMELVPGADPSDGMLEVVIFRAQRVRHLAVVAFRALIGRNRSDRLLEIHRGQHVVIETDSPQPVQVDGNEAGSALRLEARIEPGTLQVMAPVDPGLASNPLFNVMEPVISPAMIGGTVATTAAGAVWLWRNRQARQVAGRIALGIGITGAALTLYAYLSDR